MSTHATRQNHGQHVQAFEEYTLGAHRRMFQIAQKLEEFCRQEELPIFGIPIFDLIVHYSGMVNVESLIYAPFPQVGRIKSWMP